MKSDVTPWQRTYDCERSTFGVVAECVHGSSLLVVCWSRQGILAVHGCQSFCSFCAYPTTAGPLPVMMSDTMFVPKTVFRISDCLLWHVLNDTKIQNYYATPMVTKKNGLNYSKLNYYFRTGSVVNKVSRLYKIGNRKLVMGSW